MLQYVEQNQISKARMMITFTGLLEIVYFRSFCLACEQVELRVLEKMYVASNT